MKKAIFSAVTGLSLIVASCNNSGVADVNSNLPKPGTIIDSVSEPVLEDTLNHSMNKVFLIADSNVKNGTYAIKAEHGAATADGMFTLPKGLKEYKLYMKKAGEPYTYIIGFTIPGDTASHDYMEVKAGRTTIGMRYLKSYTFE